MQTQQNRKGCIEHLKKSQHLRLNDLRNIVRCADLENQYLNKGNIPEYPRPEFHVSHLKHDTERGALYRIRKDKGFKDPHGGSGDLPLVWWSLAVGPAEIQSAEARLLKNTFPNRTKQQAAEQENFLWKFATSPAFSRRSRLGSYRFRFPLQEVLTAYRQQFCSGAPPIMRVFKTSLYKQEVQYAVLVHSPANQELFSEYPLLPDDDPDAVCTYRDGHFIWRSEAMCKTHRYELIQRPEENQMDIQELFGSEHEFYVWDNVAVALHVENRQVLKFDSDQLKENLRFCWPDRKTIPEVRFDHFIRAKFLVKRLWPGSSRLEKEPSLMPF